jgi:16S rRNA (guanine966-N2)-methyltransferase
VRPTAEALRDAWVTSLEKDLAGARVLDLFAGSGGLGLEALSRGAASVDFVENGRAALHALKANVARLRVRGSTRVFDRDALAFLEALPAEAYDVAFADPPYTSSLAERVVERWTERPFARVLGVEHAADRGLPGRGRALRVGEGAVTVFRARRPAKRNN